MKVCLAIPNTGSIAIDTMTSLVSMLWTPADRAYHLAQMRGCYVDENRTKLVREAQSASCDKLLFIDTDLIFPGDTLDRLLAHDKLIVGCNYHERGQVPPVSTVKPLKGRKVPERTFKCRAVATGLMLIDMAVFDQLPPPWFQNTYFADGTLRQGEDIFFCDKAREAGIDVWCDPTIQVSHIGDYAY